MAYYRTCPDCGAHFDPGERCDCHDEPVNLPNGQEDKEANQYD